MPAAFALPFSASAALPHSHSEDLDEKTLRYPLVHDAQRLILVHSRAQ